MVLLHFKDGVGIHTLDTRLFPGLLSLCQMMEEVLEIKEVWITSVNEGQHKRGSLHYVGQAVDIRTKPYPREKVQQVLDAFKRFYDSEYDLIWEYKDLPAEHFHLEFDPGNKNSGG